MRLLFLDCSSAFGKSEAEPLELRYQALPGNEEFSLFVEHPNSIRRVLFRRFLTSR